MDYLLIGIAAVVIVALLIGLYKYYYKSANSAPEKKASKKQSGPSFAHCPLCNSPLPKGENIFSKVYRPMDVPDQRCTISGCPHCYPTLEPGLKRICPVCHKQVPMDGYLIARLFNKKDNKKHVHIVFCTQCQRGPGKD